MKYQVLSKPWHEVSGSDADNVIVVSGFIHSCCVVGSTYSGPVKAFSVMGGVSSIHGGNVVVVVDVVVVVVGIVVVVEQ